MNGKRRSQLAIWAWPAIIAGVSLLGLLALLMDVSGIGTWVALMCTAMPLWVIAICCSRSSIAKR